MSDDDRIAREKALPSELIERARVDAHLRFALMSYLLGEVTLEQAMINAALVLSLDKEQLRAELLERINHCTCHHFEARR